MAGEVKTYDPSKVICTFKGIPLGGFPDGTFIKVSRSSDLWTKSTGTDGDVTRTKSLDKSGEAMLTLDQTSLSNDDLSEEYRKDELENGGIGTFTVKDINTKTELVSAKAWIRKIPDVEFGKETSSREWAFDLASVGVFIGGNESA